MRVWVRSVLAFALSAVTLAAWVGRADASCLPVGSVPPRITVEGVITAELAERVAPQRRFALAVADGAAWTIEITTGRGDTQVEDSYVGALPAVGGRYRVTGLADGTVLRLNACIPDAAVVVLAAPAAAAPGAKAAVAVVIVLGAATVVAMVTVIVVVAARRRRPPP